MSHFKGKKIIIATDLVNSVTEKCNLKNFKILKNFQGEFLKDTICEHPFNKLGFDYNVPLLDANFVNLEQGTGLVHCAPSHGPDDFNLCLKNNIKSDYTVDGAGLYTDKIPGFKNIHVFKADLKIIETLKKEKTF